MREAQGVERRTIKKVDGMPRAIFSVVDLDGFKSSFEKLDEQSITIFGANRVIVRDDKIPAIKESETRARLALLRAVREIDVLCGLIDECGK